MEIENYIPDPDEFSSHRNEMEEKNRRSSFSRLLRGYSVQDPSANFVFPALSCRRRSIERILGVLPRPIASTASRETIPVMHEDDEMELVDDLESEMPVTQTRRATISAGISNKNPYYKKRPNTLKDWPFGEAKAKNDEDFFELELSIGLFAPEEVSAKVMGKELIIHCKPDPNRQRVKEAAIPREIFRCYPLPLTSPPINSDVSIIKDDYWIRIAIRKESALKSPIGLYTPEIAEILEEDPRSDVEDDGSEPEVRMDD